MAASPSTKRLEPPEVPIDRQIATIRAQVRRNLAVVMVILLHMVLLPPPRVRAALERSRPPCRPSPSGSHLCLFRPVLEVFPFNESTNGEVENGQRTLLFALQTRPTRMHRSDKRTANQRDGTRTGFQRGRLRGDKVRNHSAVSAHTCNSTQRNADQTQTPQTFSSTPNAYKGPAPFFHSRPFASIGGSMSSKLVVARFNH
jgi:hypothetical protein